MKFNRLLETNSKYSLNKSEKWRREFGHMSHVSYTPARTACDYCCNSGVLIPELVWMEEPEVVDLLDSTLET